MRRINAIGIDVSKCKSMITILGSPLFPDVSPSFSGVFSDFTSFSGRAHRFLGVVPELLLLPVFTSFFWSSSPFSGVVKETPDFSSASPDFPEALPRFPGAAWKLLIFSVFISFFRSFFHFLEFPKKHQTFPKFSPFFRCFFWIPSDPPPDFPDPLCIVRCFPGRFALTVVWLS